MYDLMRAAGVLGYRYAFLKKLTLDSIVVAGPDDPEFEIEEEVGLFCRLNITGYQRVRRIVPNLWRTV